MIVNQRGFAQVDSRREILRIFHPRAATAYAFEQKSLSACGMRVKRDLGDGEKLCYFALLGRDAKKNILDRCSQPVLLDPLRERISSVNSLARLLT